MYDSIFREPSHTEIGVFIFKVDTLLTRNVLTRNSYGKQLQK